MRRTMNIQFKSYEMIERFIREIADVRGEFDLVSGRRVVDARSFSWNFQPGSFRTACTECCDR